MKNTQTRHVVKAWSMCFGLLVTAAVAVGQSAPTSKVLDIGDPAPPFEVGQWLKGSPIEKLEKNKTYVIEFWASWCGPCKESMPQMTQLQMKYGDKVTFIGVESFEPDWSKSTPFVQSIGDKIGYRLVADKLQNPTDREGFMAKTWMEAADETGIPTAFVVRDGQIGWIGNPMSMDGALEAVVSDGWHEGLGRDRQLAKEQATQRKAEGEKLLADYKSELGSKDWAAAFRSLDAYSNLGSDESEQAAGLRDSLFHTIGDVVWLHKYIASQNAKSAQAMSTLSDIASNENEVAALRDLDEAQADVEQEISAIRLRHLDVYLKCGDMVAFAKLARSMIDSTDKSNPNALDHVAWLIACPDPATNDRIGKLKFPMGYGNVPGFPSNCRRDTLLPLARIAITRAIALTNGKEASYYDTLAWVDYQTGDRSAAAKAEVVATAKAPNGTLEQANYQFVGQWFEGKTQR